MKHVSPSQSICNATTEEPEPMLLTQLRSCLDMVIMGIAFCISLHISTFVHVHTLSTETLPCPFCIQASQIQGGARRNIFHLVSSNISILQTSSTLFHATFQFPISVVLSAFCLGQSCRTKRGDENIGGEFGKATLQSTQIQSI